MSAKDYRAVVCSKDIAVQVDIRADGKSKSACRICKDALEVKSEQRGILFLDFKLFIGG
jgi:hypothetical protein